MNKKAIFVLLLLFGSQITNVLYASDNTNGEVQAALEQDRKDIIAGVHGVGMSMAVSGGSDWTSNKPELQNLIEEFQVVGSDSDGNVKISFPTRYVKTIRRFYPDFNLQIRKVNLKPARST